MLHLLGTQERPCLVPTCSKCTIASPWWHVGRTALVHWGAETGLGTGSHPTASTPPQSCRHRVLTWNADFKTSPFCLQVRELVHTNLAISCWGGSNTCQTNTQDAKFCVPFTAQWQTSPLLVPPLSHTEYLHPTTLVTTPQHQDGPAGEQCRHLLAAVNITTRVHHHPPGRVWGGFLYPAAT